MANELYFLPILIRALQQPNAQEALRQAFAEIVTLGQTAEYSEGFQQFEQFMNQVRESARPIHSVESPKDIGVEDPWASESSEDEWEAWMLELIRIADQIHEPRIFLETEGKTMVHFPLSKPERLVSVSNLSPGWYRLKLDSGWIVWEGELTREDLIWKEAFPGRPLDLAAATEEGHRSATREISLWEGDITLRIYPGLETGSLEITWRETGAQRC